ncbi:transposase [Streptomyces sp. NPDC048279]|uniref:transposase n=1 Tax=Streptomyces sp. NPDC048279 TaxID=3154714 RepID=UPI0034135990
MGSKDERPRESSNTVRTGSELARLTELDRELAEQLVNRARSEGLNLVGENGLLKGLVKLVLEGALEAGMTEHLGYEKGDKAGVGSGNSRNGTSRKRVLTDVGAVEIDVPRDRAGSFSPSVVPKHQRRVEGFDEAILSLYAKGLTTGEVQAHLAEIYDVDVSRDLISRATDKITEELEAWRQRPLDRGRFPSVVATPERSRTYASRWSQQAAAGGAEGVLRAA